MEAGVPLTDFMSIYFTTLYSRTYEHGLAVDQQGNLYRGRWAKDDFARGFVVGPRGRAMKVDKKVGDRYSGMLLLGNEDLCYEGDTDHLTLAGYGALTTRLGKKVFTGQFLNDVPHGFGVMYDKLGKLSKDSFEGQFCNGVKRYGIIVDEPLFTEGAFNRLIEDPKSNNKTGFQLSLTESLQLNQKSFDIQGWVVSKESGIIKYGKFKDSEKKLTGLYRVHYTDNEFFKGYLKDNLRDGDFIAMTPDRNILIGNWKHDQFKGVICWNESDKQEFSHGVFKLNDSGELEQSAFGKIKFKDGDVYQGQITNNKAHGYGKLLKKDGGYYVGEFADGVYNGAGEELHVSSKSLYRGFFRGGCKHGMGSLRLLESSTTIHGYFQEDRCTVSFTEHCGLKVFGQRVALLTAQVKVMDGGSRHENDGVCVAELETKANEFGKLEAFRYEGQIVRGSITGLGAIIKKEVDEKGRDENHETKIYEGEFRDGKIEGRGRWDVMPKCYYLGETKDNQIYGIGSLREANFMWQGRFDNLKKNGIFVVFFKRDAIRIVEFVDDKPVNYALMKDFEVNLFVSNPQTHLEVALVKYEREKLDPIKVKTIAGKYLLF